jgi:hypothetical protein
MGVVPDVAVVKQIGDLTTEFQAAKDEAKKVEIISKITEKEKELRALRQNKGRFKAVIRQPTKLW